MGTKKVGLAEIVRSPLCWVLALVVFLLGTAQGIGADRLFLVDRTSEQACEQAASIAEEPIQTKMLQVADDGVADRCDEPVNCSEICAENETWKENFGRGNDFGLDTPGLQKCSCDCGRGRDSMIVLPAWFSSMSEEPPSKSCVCQQIDGSHPDVHLVCACPESVLEVPEQNYQPEDELGELIPGYECFRALKAWRYEDAERGGLWVDVTRDYKLENGILLPWVITTEAENFISTSDPQDLERFCIPKDEVPRYERGPHLVSEIVDPDMAR